MSLSVYLFFDGNCAEVFDFYRSVFGGEFASRSTFADAPPELGFPENEADKVMHVTLPIGESVLMGSDTSSTHGPAPTQGGNFAISYSAQSRDHADTVFAQLSGGGEIVMPMQDTIWESYFGMCTDKFGIKWMVSYSKM